MPKFVYIGGETKSEHFSEMTDDRNNTVVTDERRGVDMPDVTTAFGIKFVIGKPTDVDRSMFPDQAKYEHALMKLKVNRYFEPFAEDVDYVMVAPDKAPAELPKRGPGRPPNKPQDPSEFRS